jgi:polar amino acid transport system substrate-binding protein
MLERGRVDNVLTFSLIGQQMIKKLNLTGVRMLQPPLESVNVYPYLHKKHQQLITPLALGLKALKQSGRYQQIEQSLLQGTPYQL